MGVTASLRAQTVGHAGVRLDDRAQYKLRESDLALGSAPAREPLPVRPSSAHEGLAGRSPLGRDTQVEAAHSMGARQRIEGPWTLTVGMPPPTRAITAKDGSRVGLDSRWTVQAGTCTKSPGPASM